MIKRETLRYSFYHWPVFLFAASVAFVVPAGCSLLDERPQRQREARVCVEADLCDTDATRVLIAYHGRLSDRDGTELQQARRSLVAPADTPLEQVRQAIVLSHPRAPADLARALGLLDAVLVNGDDDARALHGIARMLSNEVRARQRLGQQVERAGAQLEAAEVARAQLQQKLDALTEIERSLPARPASDATLPETDERSDPR
jgi:hypothetical protein